MDRGQRVAGRQHCEWFHAPGVEITGAEQDGTNVLLRKTCKGRFEIAISPCIKDNELKAQSARCRLKVCDDGLGRWKRRVYENAKQARIGYQLTEQLQLFRRQLGRKNGG